MIGGELTMAGYFTYYINVYDEQQHLKQLFGIGTYKTKQAARSAAVHHLEDSNMTYRHAHINIMHYTAGDYNDRNEPEITIKGKGL